MDVNSIADALQGQLGHALGYLGTVAGADVVFGILVGGFLKRNFTLRRLADFTVTTLGYQKLLAFLGALFLMYVHGDHYTTAAVASLAGLYATSILPDLYDKVSTLIFGGKLPLSQNLVAPGANTVASGGATVTPPANA